VESPGGWSESSHYSNSESAPSRIHGARIDSVNTGSSSYSPLDYRNMYGSQFGEARRGLLEPSTGDYEPDRIERRNGVTSGGTYRGENPDDPDDPVNRTPMAPVKNVMDLQFPMSQYPRQVVSPAQSDRSAKQITPTRAGFSRNGSANPSPRGYTPESGRIALIAPPDLSQRALDALEKEAEVAPGSDRMDVRAVGRDEETQSSPASNGDFGGLKREEEVEDTLKGRNRRTLPATTSSSSGAIVEAALPPRREEMLSPEIYGRQTPSSKGSDENSGSPSPARSPEPPPRSNLRVQ